MKKILMKFCDERKRKFCIRTVIAEDEKTKKKFVYKSNVYPEGTEHIRTIFENRELLEKAYPDMEICPVQMNGNEELQFDYIEGKTLESFYREAVMQNNRKEIERLLVQHAGLLEGCEENQCAFVMTPQFQKIFRMDEWNGSMQGLKISNFDANAGNIVYRSEMPVFIDYEWVFDFPVPRDLVIYYNIHDAYQHIKRFEEVYPLEDAMKLLKITIDEETREKISSGFFSYVYQQDDGVSFALSKYINAKGTKNYQDYDMLVKKCQDYDMLVKKCEDYDFIVKNWRDAVQANALLSKQLQQLEAAKNAEVAQERENHRIHAKQLEDAVQEQARQSETWRIAYETVIHSRTWHIANKLKRLMGRKTQQ